MPLVDWLKIRRCSQRHIATSPYDEGYGQVESRLQRRMVDSEESAEVKAEPAPEFKLLQQGRWRLVTAASFVAWQGFGENITMRVMLRS